jgi:hypothetical protein
MLRFPSRYIANIRTKTNAPATKYYHELLSCTPYPISARTASSNSGAQFKRQLIRKGEKGELILVIVFTLVTGRVA